LLGPAAYDGISAKLTERAGFDFAFMSGFCVAGARLGLPDTGLLSYGEMVEQGRQMIEATSSMPIIGDGDTGHGNAMNVKRTVKGYAAAGFSGILIEDQVWPKSCGHVKGKRVVPRDEAVARIKAACDARDEGQDIVIVARTDARQAMDFQEALERAQRFADAGADIVFVDALESAAEMRTFCAEISGAHKMANMLEGGGKTPILSPSELEAMGFKLCAYPLSLMGVAVSGMQDALRSLKKGEIPPNIPDFKELQDVVGFPEYFEQEARYAVPAESTQGPSTILNEQKEARSNSESVRPQTTRQGLEQDSMQGGLGSIEPDVVIEPDSEPYAGSNKGNVNPEGTYDVAEYDSPGSSKRSKWLRVRISDSSSGQVKLDTRFPGGFLDSVAAFVPQVAGIDLNEILGTTDMEKQKVGPVFSFDADGDRVDIFVELK
jgi:2-methylisocitrate lyase-like PEP mutase family enzyme